MRRHSKAPDLAEQVQAVEQVLAAGGHRLEADVTRRARALIGKVGDRLRLSGEHTVIALAGATGSGKSTLFNALVGAEISAVGVRRPTTGTALACVWGGEDVTGLLDWLGVPRRHEVAIPPGDPALANLVLLDLPDHDSTEAAHRVEVDRLVALVDVFVWVTDPQKYADAALHRRYLRPLAGHDAVTIVLLNQADLLNAAELAACRRDLQRLLTADGLGRIEVIPTSATTGVGLDRLRADISAALVRRTARVERLAADLDDLAAELGRSLGDGEPDLAHAGAEVGLIAALADAAGVGVVAAAAAEAHRAAGAKATGWPFSRWVRGLRPDPLRRLRLGGAVAPAPLAPGQPGDGPVLQRSSLPAPTKAQLATVDVATRRVAEAAADGLPVAWADAVRAAARPHTEDLADALDAAVVRTDLTFRRPASWPVLGAVQWLLALAAIVGAIWLIVLGVLGALKIPQPATPYLGPVPVPTVLLVAGVVLGLLLAMLSRALVARGAQRRADQVRRRLDASIAEVARGTILAPVEQVLADHREAREALAKL